MDDRDLERYSRQLLVPGLELEGQEALAGAHVLLVGCGGLGAAVGLYLAGSGLGRITLVDDDCVELSNLPRQIAFTEQDLGVAKAEAFGRRLRDMNRSLAVDVRVGRFDSGSAGDLLRSVDCVVDGTDNHSSRRLIDLETARRRIPWFMGAAVQMAGQNVAFSPDRGEGCYHCLAPESVAEGDNPCARLGILGPVVGSVAMQQVIDVIGWLAGVAVVPWGLLRQRDFRSGEAVSLPIGKRTDCPVCG